MGLLIGCLVVSVGNLEHPEYVPWAWFWGFTTAIVGCIFVAQTLRESR